MLCPVVAIRMKASPFTSRAVPFLLVVAALGGLALMLTQQSGALLKPGAIAGKEVHTANARDDAFCEIVPVLRTPSAMVVEFYNTTGTSGPGGGCPAEKFAAIDAKQLAADLKVFAVHMNPSPQSARRHWVMDENWVYKVGETVNFMGVDATWMASMTIEQLRGGIAKPYDGSQIRRATKYLYKKGSEVFLMRTADRKTYVMQSYVTEVDNDLTYAQLGKLGSKLNLPAGWTFETKRLRQDLMVDPQQSNGVAHIIRDDLHNVYEGCGFDAACNYVP